MKKIILITCLIPVSLHAKIDISKSFKTVKKHLKSIEKELITFTKNTKPYEVRNLTALIRTHINLMAAGTTALAPQYAQQELHIKKHLDAPTKILFPKIRDTAHELNPPAKLFGGSTISFEAETYLAGIIAILCSELDKKEPKPKMFKATSPRKKEDRVKKIHKEGLTYIKKHTKLLKDDDKKLLVHERGLIETYKKLHHAKAQKGSIGPAASAQLKAEINAAANREIELFSALSDEAKKFFKQIREYAQNIDAEDTFMGGLSPKVIAFLDDIKKKL